MEKEIFNEIDNYRNEAIKNFIELLRIPAISPDYGGEGEIDKANKLLEILKEYFNFDTIEKYYSTDNRAKEKVRPNIIATYKGNEKKALWIITHIDVVPPGDLNAWKITKPFEPKIVDGKLYARGSEDNGQSLVASLYAVKSLMAKKIIPNITIKLAFVSDEEAGSEYGMKYLLKNHPEIFNKDDYYLIPDAGNSDGSLIEIAEKSILQFRLIIRGKQVHASTPHLGLNSHRISIQLSNQIDYILHERFKDLDELFDPPYSTFEPTMVKNSASSPNIIPGLHEITFDSRVIPKYKLDDVLNEVKNVIKNVEDKNKKIIEGIEYPQIELELIDKMQSPRPTNPNNKLVLEIKKAIKELRNVEAKIGGIGGITFASMLRSYDYDAVVWSTTDDVAHQPNEYSVLENLFNDAKVFALLMNRLR
ncbi:acetylornithine deacetylase or succinyl-diaminopimelate desuccinylase [Caldisphaera lagunensis DSM 15908]|uniref:Acetylornithine deacetylase or succinyl-diaminopimelate desuccinylase n=1 Tax=Caldisphaera lagunensis (strain DSM 15908 / JCM 11604 / ANMR 0165 / IC-154) TaxID=1056495 RepID=L0A9U1_CALLD|nr:M20 family metallo-hydrolase [Caldisphaera lagunensis]AFZ69912.1 acetylornithine deacetylase or succinyl-diaminopimelate desuccinylase [Caldisphaera lagunensis DSM 15908]